MTTRRVLGRGLSALIPEGRASVVTKSQPQGVQEIPVHEIVKAKDQPRVRFDELRIEELSSSIKEKGVIQPLIVRPTADGKYELIAGERRLRAAIAAGVTQVPVMVREAADDDALELALIENIQRENLNVIEEAEAYRKLIEKYELTQEEVAAKVGKDRATVANALRLLALPDDIKTYIHSGKISMGHARALLSLGSRQNQRRAVMLVIQKTLSVRETESLVKRINTPAVRVRETERDPQYAKIEEAMERALGCRVICKPLKKGGKIEIAYRTNDDLDRMLDLLEIDVSS